MMVRHGLWLAVVVGVFYPPLLMADSTEWIRTDAAQLQALDKITARIATIEAVVGVPFRYGSLEITVHACTTRPPTLAPENAALLAIRTVSHDGVVAETPIFDGWMFASSPAINALEHPIYDVSVLACKNSPHAKAQ